MSKLEEKKETTNKCFIVYHKQRWDEVDLIKGFTDKKEAEKLVKSLEEKEDRYVDVYTFEEIEIEIKNAKESKQNKNIISDLDGVIERLQMEFPLIYKEISKPIGIGFSDNEEKDFMKVMIIPELQRIITALKEGSE